MDPTFVVETSAQVLEIVDTGLETLIATRARAVLPAPMVVDLLKLREEASWTPDQIDLVKKAVAEICRKYDFAAKYAPEILLGLMLTQYGVKQARVFAALARMETQIRQMRKVSGKPATAEVPTPPPADKVEEPKDEPSTPSAP